MGRIGRIVSRSWRGAALLLVGVVVGATLITPALAHVGSWAHNWNKHIKPKVQTFGDNRWLGQNTVLYASVSSTGTVGASSGGVSSGRTGIGLYNVTFPRNVRGCANVATAGDGAQIVQQIGNERYGGPVEEVRVRVYDAAGAAADGGFFLVVICNPG
jgi:hypothetical protein